MNKASSPHTKEILRIGRFLTPYRVYGNKGSELICVNGVQQTMAMWSTLVARFEPEHKIVLFDFPNQGKGKVLSGPLQLSLDEQVEILAALIDKTGLSSDATLCTASWGGVVAVAFASKYPERIRHLILASLGTKPNKKMAQTIKEGASLPSSKREQMAHTLIKSFGENLPEKLKANIVNQFRTMKQEKLQLFYEHGLFVLTSKELGEVVNLGAIKAKTILLNGENDTIIDLEDVRFLASQIPDCELKIIKGVGHFLHMENESVLDIYASILSSQS